jgi:GNAT superfamily N-acetyltransferase
VAEPKFQWRGGFENRELDALHAQAFAHAVLEIDWAAQVAAHSLGWVTARDAGELVGFVNVAWDGGAHALVLDTMVTASRQRQGIGARLVAIAAAGARAAGCEWLHVDFDEEHRAFYLDACGFEPTPAGLMAL